MEPDTIILRVISIKYQVVVCIYMVQESWKLLCIRISKSPYKGLNRGNWHYNFWGWYRSNIMLFEAYKWTKDSWKLYCTRIFKSPYLGHYNETWHHLFWGCYLWNINSSEPNTWCCGARNFSASEYLGARTSNSLCKHCPQIRFGRESDQNLKCTESTPRSETCLVTTWNK